MSSKEPRVKVHRDPTLVEAAAGILFLLIMILVGNILMGLSVELMFVIGTFFVGWIGIRCGYTYKELEEGMMESVASNSSILVIMLGIGFVIGSWTFSGTVPVMIGFLANLISVKYVLVLSFVFCAIIAAIIGTSSATMGTIGVIMLSVATIQGVSPGIAAAAVITGSFLGQVTSVLADMVNFNSPLTGNTPQQTIKLCLPSEIIGVAASIIFFYIVGLRMDAQSTPGSLNEINQLVDTVFSCYHSSIIVLLPVAALFVLILLKVQVIPTLFTAGFVALLVGVFYQDFSLQAAFSTAYGGFNTSMLNIAADTELMPQFVKLVTRGGMISMADFLISIPLMMAYVGMLAKVGAAQVLAQALFKNVKRAGNVIACNTISALFLTAATGSIMASSILCTKMFGTAYENAGLSRRNMVASYQFSCTMGVLLFPWCAVTMYATGIVGIPAIQWIPYLVMIYVPIVAHIILGYLGVGVVKLTPEEKLEVEARRKAEAENSMEVQ